MPLSGIVRYLGRAREAAHHRTLLVAAAASLAALAVGTTVGGVAGLAFVLAVVCLTVAATFWVRVRQLERDVAALLAAQRPAVGIPQTIAPDVSGVAGPDAAESGTAVAGPPDDPVPATGHDVPAPVAGVVLDADGAVPDERVDRVVAEAPLDVPPVDTTTLEPGFTTWRTAAEPMASFTLPSLRGTDIDAATLHDRPAVLVFWHPNCQHSQRLTPELSAWESLQAANGPRLIVLAACEAADAWRAGVPGLVLLDPSFSIGQRLEITGTPSAMLIDRDWRPVGEIAAGTAAVTGLLREAMRRFSPDDLDELDDAPVAVAEGETVQPGNRPAVLLHRVGDGGDAGPAPAEQDAPRWDDHTEMRRTG